MVPLASPRERVGGVERERSDDADARRRLGEGFDHLGAKVAGGEGQGVRAPARRAGDAHPHHHRPPVDAVVAEVLHRYAAEGVADAGDEDVRDGLGREPRRVVVVRVQQRLGLDREADDDDRDARELPGGENLAGDEDVEEARYGYGRAAHGLVEAAAREADGLESAHQPDEVGEREEVEDQAGSPRRRLLRCLLLACLDLDSREATRLKPTSLMYMRPTIWRTDASTKSSLMMRWALRK